MAAEPRETTYQRTYFALAGAYFIELNKDEDDAYKHFAEWIKYRGEWARSPRKGPDRC